MAQGIRNLMFPQEVRETRKVYEKIKQEWEQKYATGVQWQAIAESAIQQQIERLRLDKELQRKKVEPNDKRPMVVAPQEVGKDKWPSKEGHQKNSDEKETDIRLEGLGNLLSLELQIKNKRIGNNKKQ